jgi:hypothetical protein
MARIRNRAALGPDFICSVFGESQSVSVGTLRPVVPAHLSSLLLVSDLQNESTTVVLRRECALGYVRQCIMAVLPEQDYRGDVDVTASICTDPGFDGIIYTAVTAIIGFVAMCVIFLGGLLFGCLSILTVGGVLSSMIQRLCARECEECAARLAAPLAPVDNELEVVIEKEAV